MLATTAMCLAVAAGSFLSHDAVAGPTKEQREAIKEWAELRDHVESAVAANPGCLDDSTVSMGSMLYGWDAKVLKDDPSGVEDLRDKLKHFSDEVDATVLWCSKSETNRRAGIDGLADPEITHRWNMTMMRISDPSDGIRDTAEGCDGLVPGNDDKDIDNALESLEKLKGEWTKGPDDLRAGVLQLIDDAEARCRGPREQLRQKQREEVVSLVAHGGLAEASGLAARPRLRDPELWSAYCEAFAEVAATMDLVAATRDFAGPADVPVCTAGWANLVHRWVEANVDAAVAGNLADEWRAFDPTTAVPPELAKELTDLKACSKSASMGDPVAAWAILGGIDSPTVRPCVSGVMDARRDEWEAEVARREQEEREAEERRKPFEAVFQGDSPHGWGDLIQEKLGFYQEIWPLIQELGEIRYVERNLDPLSSLKDWRMGGRSAWDERRAIRSVYCPWRSNVIADVGEETFTQAVQYYCAERFDQRPQRLLRMGDPGPIPPRDCEVALNLQCPD